MDTHASQFRLQPERNAMNFLIRFLVGYAIVTAVAVLLARVAVGETWRHYPSPACLPLQFSGGEGAPNQSTTQSTTAEIIDCTSAGGRKQMLKESRWNQPSAQRVLTPR